MTEVACREVWMSQVHCTQQPEGAPGATMPPFMRHPSDPSSHIHSALNFYFGLPNSIRSLHIPRVDQNLGDSIATWTPAYLLLTVKSAMRPRISLCSTELGYSWSWSH